MEKLKRTSPKMYEHRDKNREEGKSNNTHFFNTAQRDGMERRVFI